MSDSAGGVAGEMLRIRKERVHSTMLIELLVLLVFLAIAFAFVTKDESSASAMHSRIQALEAKIKILSQENTVLRSQVADLARTNAELKSLLDKLLKTPPDKLPANAPTISMTKGEYDRLMEEIANLKAMLAEQRKANGDLRGVIAATGRGVDLPVCPVTAGFLVSVDLMGNGTFVVRPAWAPGARDAVAGVDGAMELASPGAKSEGVFRAQAARIKAWGRAQPEQCAFKAVVTEHHSNLSLYKRQMRAVEGYFYARRN